MSDSLVVAQLARKLAELEERLAAVERGPQLAHSSIEAGTLEVFDEAGASVLQMGLQEDGTYAIVGTNGGKVVADTVPQEVIDQITADLELADGAVTEAKLAASAVTETKIADDAVTSPKVVAGAIQTLHLAADSVAAGKIAANAITARELAALSVTAGKIAAGAITADRIGVGVLGGELVPDGSFESADMRAQRTAAWPFWYYDTGGPAPRYHGQTFAKVDGSTDPFKLLYLTDSFPVAGGEQYTGTWAYRGISAANGYVALQMEVTLQDGSLTWPLVGGKGTTADGTWRALTATVTLPANAVSARIYLATEGQTAGTWCADAVSVRRVVSGVEIADGAITAAKIAATAVTADKIAAGSITADRLAIGTIGGELVPDGSFESAQLRALRAINGYTFDTGSATPRHRGTAFAYRTAENPNTGPKKTTLAQAIPVTAGEEYVGTVALLTRNGADGTGQLSAAITLQDGSTVFRVLATPGTAKPTAWTTYTGKVVIPANALYLRVDLEISNTHTVGDWCFDAVSVRRVAQGVEIADGAITADKLDANAITGKVITGGTFFTRSAAPRVEMGETAYEGGAIASIKWDLLGRGWDEPVIQASVLAGNARRFQIRGPAGIEGTAGTSLVAETTDYAWKMQCWTDPLTAISTYVFNPTGGLEMTLPRSAGAKHLTFNEGYSLYADNAGAGGANNRVWLDGPNGGEVVIGPRAGTNLFGSIKLRTGATTTSAANTHLDTGFQVRKVSSALKYKTDVQDLGYDPEVLRGLRPVRFRDRNEVAEQGDSARWYAGFIAEEVDALGLAELVTYDLDGKPDALQYERFAAALLLLIKDQDRQLTEMGERLAELERRLGSG